MKNNLGNKKIFAENLKYYMAKNNKTSSDMCNALGYSKGTFSGWYNGTYYPRIDKIEEMAKYLGINKSDLIEDRSVIENSEHLYTFEEQELISNYRQMKAKDRFLAYMQKILELERMEDDNKQ